MSIFSATIIALAATALVLFGNRSGNGLMRQIKDLREAKLLEKISSEEYQSRLKALVLKNTKLSVLVFASILIIGLLFGDKISRDIGF
ncbi:MAG: hypothetical protein HRU19_02575 [Pseudobacteriovorax sp.]|nr:hypothetical protein [Pseudobacteriovorax sp.]